MTEDRMYLFGTISILSALSLVVTLTAPFTGLIMTAATIIGGIVVGTMLTANSQLEREFGFGSLTEMETQSAYKWGALTLVMFTLFVFDELFFLGGVIMVAYAALVYFLDNVSDQRKTELLLQRLGIAMLFFIAQFLSFLLILPVAVMLARYAWIFIPQNNKQTIGEGSYNG